MRSMEAILFSASLSFRNTFLIDLDEDMLTLRKSSLR